MLKSRNAGGRTDNGAAATDGSGSPAVGSGVCGQWHAAKRVLPQSRFGLEHAGSPSEEEKEEKQRGGWPGRGGIGHAEVAERARAELWAGRGVSGGRRIEVRGDFDPHTLERLVSVLERV